MQQDLADWLTKAFKLMLNSNTFEYDAMFCQASGTAIGAHFSCACSGCAMARVEVEGLRKWRERFWFEQALQRYF